MSPSRQHAEHRTGDRQRPRRASPAKAERRQGGDGDVPPTAIAASRHRAGQRRTEDRAAQQARPPAALTPTAPVRWDGFTAHPSHGVRRPRPRAAAPPPCSATPGTRSPGSSRPRGPPPACTRATPPRDRRGADRDRQVGVAGEVRSTRPRRRTRRAGAGSSSSMISSARGFGAPERVPAGKVARKDVDGVAAVGAGRPRPRTRGA